MFKRLSPLWRNVGTTPKRSPKLSRTTPKPVLKLSRTKTNPFPKPSLRSMSAGQAWLKTKHPAYEDYRVKWPNDLAEPHYVSLSHGLIHTVQGPVTEFHFSLGTIQDYGPISFTPCS